MSDPAWTDVLQTLAVVGALIFTGWQIRAGVHEQKLQTYFYATSGSRNLSALMVENPELHAIYEYSQRNLTKKYKEMSAEDKARIHYCDALIALFETVWVASQEEGAFEDEWEYWRRWAHGLNGSPYFRWMLEEAKRHEEYDKIFLNDISVSAKQLA
jgi:hypothetical protein